MQITIGEINKYGKFDVTIGGITIKGCSYKSGTNAKGAYEFIGLPQHKVTGKDGAEKWVGDVSMDRDTAAAVLAAYKSATADTLADDDIPF